MRASSNVAVVLAGLASLGFVAILQSPGDNRALQA
jgi:hypothetical protein